MSELVCERVEFPIRLIIGGSYGACIAIVYETPDGNANMKSFDHPKLFRFVDAGKPSVIVFNVTRSKDFIGGSKEDWKIVEVRICRDWQFKT